ncbi:carbohydrate-binding protein [Chryseolinea soli]|uniref:Carbohydrate-binding protein n=2 Tax=Chryseolinea soli TaxID=2321403 RepID=A0A385T3N9_9BACT|nr:carbohydrate-binding protein [Chryseolinea soli]
MALVAMMALLLSFRDRMEDKPRVLVFSKTDGFRHTSIEAGKVAIKKMADEKGFDVDFTEDAHQFVANNLKRYNAVVWLNTTGDVLNPEQQTEFERYIQAGGGYVGIHAATDCEYEWNWYGRLAGAFFLDHPNPENVQKGKFYVVEKDHWATKGMPDEFERTDEFYSFKQIDPSIKVLIGIDEKSYKGGKNGDHHPMSWYHDFDGGRSFYTAMGHTDETFSEPLFLDHLWAGLQYAIGEKGLTLDYEKSKPEENRFSKVILKEKLNEPMELSVLNNGRILFIERHGAVRLYNTQTKQLKTIATIPVSTKYKDRDGKVSESEDGLLGLSKDPNFATNHWIYLYYSDPVKSQNILTRYTLVGDVLDLNSKKVLLAVATQREQCCHTGGSIAFDKESNLYVSTGDNTNPHGSNGYSPSDERPDRSPWDAQKSSSNSNDLRGKILRIKPKADGTYSIPEGNLFPKGTAKTRPEIYTMGHRNPFRISIDQKTGFVYWGEVGPDANDPDATRGPAGQDEVGQARAAGNFGWPYFVGDNKAYYKYDFTANKSLEKWDPSKPINTSPNNTGISELPPAQKALIWYPYAESQEFPLVGTGGRNAMAGPVFYSEHFKLAKRSFPKYYDGKLFTYDWMRGWIMSVTLDKEGNYVSMERFMPSYRFSNPMDMEFSADGDLYMLEYGSGWFTANDDARLVKIEYNGGNRKPEIKLTADQLGGSIPFTTTLSSEGTKDADGDSLNFSWKVTSKTGYNKTLSGPIAKLSLAKPDIYKATLTVIDGKGGVSTQSLELAAGNEPPVLKFDIGKENKSFYFPDRTYHYKIMVEDKEDGSIANGKIKADQVVVNIDYLAEGFDKVEIAQGHRTADASANVVKGMKLIEGADCKACHSVDKKSIGPTYREVSLKYKGATAAQQNLVKKVISGGSGVWGEVPMAAHPQLSAEDAAEMVKYILSLAEAKPKTKSLPVEGVYTAKLPAGDKGQGVYIFRAAYRDRGASGLPSLSSEETFTLRSPKINPSNYDLSNDVNKMSYGGNKFVIPTKSGSYVGLSNIDLTGVTQMEITAVAPKAQLNAAGGFIEVHIDSPKGKLFGKSDFIGDGGFGSSASVINLEQTTGFHTLYLVFTNPELKGGGALMVVMNTTFKSENSPSETKRASTESSTVELNDYAGKYKMTGLPFEFIVITIKDGKVMMDASGQIGELKPTVMADTYDADGKATINFIRDEKNAVNKLKMDAMGFSFQGSKE